MILFCTLLFCIPQLVLITFFDTICFAQNFSGEHLRRYSVYVITYPWMKWTFLWRKWIFPWRTWMLHWRKWTLGSEHFLEGSKYFIERSAYFYEGKLVTIIVVIPALPIIISCLTKSSMYDLMLIISSWLGLGPSGPLGTEKKEEVFKYLFF